MELLTIFLFMRAKTRTFPSMRKEYNFPFGSMISILKWASDLSNVSVLPFCFFLAYAPLRKKKELIEIRNQLALHQ